MIFSQGSCCFEELFRRLIGSVRMKPLFLILSTLSIIFMSTPTQAQSIYDFTMTTIEGEERSLARYEGQVVLVVNVASRCGLTPQYADLQELYDTYHDQGLVVLGFPANDFMGQEPGSNEQIQEFCEQKFGVTFPMFAKISVKGSERHPLYAYLEEATNERPGWNFHKYLIDRQGQQVVSIPSAKRATDRAVVDQIEAMLGAAK